jgi:hypothetical protein
VCVWQNEDSDSRVDHYYQRVGDKNGHLQAKTIKQECRTNKNVLTGQNGPTTQFRLRSPLADRVSQIGVMFPIFGTLMQQPYRAHENAR